MPPNVWRTKILRLPAMRTGILTKKLNEHPYDAETPLKNAWPVEKCISLPGLFLPARIVLRIDVIELHRRHPVDLHHNIAAGHRVVVHVGIEIGKAARGKTQHAALVEVVAHANFECPRNHSHILAVRMPMRCD